MNDTTYDIFDEAKNDMEATNDKLITAQTLGVSVEMEPQEAERFGAFIEDSLTEKEALDSVIDGVDIEPGNQGTTPTFVDDIQGNIPDHLKERYPDIIRDL